MPEGENKLQEILENVLVVDDDSLCLKLTVSQLKSLGATKIDTAEDGESGFNQAKSGTYSLIVQDWKLPTLSGMALFNRLRNLPAYQWAPILVVSGFLNKNDFKLLQEFPCTALAEKPFTQKIIKDRITKLNEESNWYQHHKVLVDEVFATVNHDPSKISQVIYGVIKKSPNPTPLVLIAVKALSNLGAFKTAQTVLEALIKIDPDSVMARNELGKVLMQRGKHQEALRVLEKCENFSSQNISRLCLMGEANLNLTDFDKARDYFSKALSIDSEEPKALDGYHVSKNLIDHKHRLNHVGQSFASLLNTVGIAMIHSGNFQKGVEQYKSALTFLKKPIESSKITFNLGLGYLKWGKSETALDWFRKSTEFSQGEFTKSEIYVRLLENPRRSSTSSNISSNRDDFLEYPTEGSLVSPESQQDLEAKIELDLEKDSPTVEGSNEESLTSGPTPPSGIEMADLAETGSIEALSDKITKNL
jgi:CheY-like chemotaxis protein